MSIKLQVEARFEHINASKVVEKMNGNETKNGIKFNNIMLHIIKYLIVSKETDFKLLSPSLL
jgi:hypothetical protein